MLSALFVYGTLKQGHLRSRTWPHPPQAIREGLVRGRLLDLGPYPGLLPGQDWILGELWMLAANHLAETLEVLDQVEGYDSRTDRGLYLRRSVSVWCLDPRGDAFEESPVQADTYLIADERRIAAARWIEPSVAIGGVIAAQWPDLLARVPMRLEDE